MNPVELDKKYLSTLQSENAGNLNLQVVKKISHIILTSFCCWAFWSPVEIREPRNSFKKVSAAQIGIFENVLSCTWVLDVDGSEKL